MELGQKLKQARLEAGLSQRQLCGDIITRNMLSQIENGSAKPSPATLQALCARLGKPVSYFGEDGASQNLKLLCQADQAAPQAALGILEAYLSPDPMLDEYYHRLSARICLSLAKQAIQEDRKGYAQTLLNQAQIHSRQCREFDNRDLTLACHQAGLSDAVALTATLPDNTGEMLLRGEAALASGDPEKCLACLAVADRMTDGVQLLKGDALLQKGDFPAAAICFEQLEDTIPQQVYSRLEICYREMGNYEKAYLYACKQR